ncbi:hypothetical protein IGB42_01729 [Andreprevotia sp. IGB-42]|uniref:DUF3106 domain-containing protein n=1 Tax=Andreprevotia sp. IGB-42 TaxID=2497473 RepID=UPI00135978AE|nr:DUF3106 domain-containing protein [Andreprevotia sp. IGB-42]KAF0814049.1 hypothetical protein IGB42_01729 [Andreprevotia sp. IGB-42]
MVSRFALIIALLLTAAFASAAVPSWQALPADQRQLLMPLAAEWNTLPEQQREHLVKVAKRYPTLQAEQQARVRERISRWASFTPAQRDQAHANYLRLQAMPAEERRRTVDRLRAEHQAETAKPRRSKNDQQ